MWTQNTKKVDKTFEQMLLKCQVDHRRRRSQEQRAKPEPKSSATTTNSSLTVQTHIERNFQYEFFISVYESFSRLFHSCTIIIYKLYF